MPIYVIALGVAVISGLLANTFVLTGRVIGLMVLGLLSVSVGLMGVALIKGKALTLESREFHKK